MKVKNIFNPAVNLDNPAAIAKFVQKLDLDNGQLSSIAHLVRGDFAQIDALASYIHSITGKDTAAPHDTSETSQANTTTKEATTNECPSTVSYAQVVEQHLPKKATPRPSRLPICEPNYSPGENYFDSQAFTLSKKGRTRIYRAEMETVSHEPKAFALLQTSADHDALKNPFSITRCLAEAVIRQPLTLVKSPDPRKFLIHAHKSAVPFIAPAYKRFYKTALRKCGVSRLQKVNVTAVSDILDLFPQSSATVDLMNFTFKLRDEIKRLESPDTTCRPRYYFAESLSEHEKSCFEALKHRNPSCDLSPMLPKGPRAQARNNGDEETRSTHILHHRVNPSPETIITPHETNVKQHATPLNQSNEFPTATVPSPVTPQTIAQSSNNTVPMDVASPSDVQNSS
ncbi:hypothetical protein BWQ96_02209 [Gracilariopsis chorda]|uniref:Uncharacterized protein n=1 Tax=Gracilariopsis chorda TaxID=448386 RepID=A0A2V3J0W2_9FLOR|nr:hypothetical protein BWQ96_02209 [Gracilariopsis chorda]|eukprot:PXF48018.1 hypothetical protein BWQ96_02209 [Gracilariopsis chorda]